MNPRKRFRAICHFERGGDLFISPYNHAMWYETVKRWVDEGAPPEILTSSTARF